MKWLIDLFTRRPSPQVWIVILSLGIMIYPAPCAASESVEFPSASPSRPVTVTGDLYRPEGKDRSRP